MKKLKGLPWKKAALTAGVMLAGLLAAGCGKKTEGATTAQKEFVYVPEYQTINLEDGASHINIHKDTIYFTTGSYDEASFTYTQYLGILKIGETTPKLVELDLGMDSNINGMYVDAEGKLQTVVTSYIPVEETEGAETTIAEEEIGTGEVEAGEGAAGESTGTEETEGEETTEAEEADGETVAAVEEEAVMMKLSATVSTSMAPVASGISMNNEPQQKTELCSFGQDGVIQSRRDITQVVEEAEFSYIQDMAADGNGNVYLCSDQKILILDSSGNRLGEVEADNWITDIFSSKDGSVMAVYHGDQGMEIHPVDAAKKQMGEKIKELQVIDYGNYTFTQGEAADFIFSVGDGLYTYNKGEQAAVEILKWTDCDLDGDRLEGFNILEDGRVLAVTSMWDDQGNNTTELVYLTKKKGSEVPEKKILTLGTMSLGFDIKSKIINFNKTNQEYRIEIKEYLTDVSMEGYQAAAEKMNADIISGQCPDLIDLSSGSFQMYAAKGVLEDLYPYIESDAEIKKEDYLENVIQAYEMDGSLYTLPSRFYISTVIAKVSDVGERTSITTEEVIELMEGLPEGTELYPYATKSSILTMNLMMNLDEYVDWNTGECRFNSEEFLQALNFANQFKTEMTNSEDQLSMPTQIREGKLLMTTNSISSVQEFQMYKGMFGEPIAFVGYPTSKESGSMISGSSDMIGISSKSPYKEGGWAFIREGLTKESQEVQTHGGGNGFPVMKSALEAQFAADMEEEYYEDAEGNKEKRPKTTWGYDDFEIEIYAATEEEIAAIRRLIESANTLYQYDEQIMTIISEETAAFFEGQKKAEEVADIIQNRIQIYVNENR